MQSNMYSCMHAQAKKADLRAALAKYLLWELLLYF